MDRSGAVGDILVFTYINLSDNTVYTENRKCSSSSSSSSSSCSSSSSSSSTGTSIFNKKESESCHFATYQQNDQF